MTRTILSWRTLLPDEGPHREHFCRLSQRVGGNLWGFEVIGDYKVMNKLLLSAGAQYNYYRGLTSKRKDSHTAQRYWIGARYSRKRISLSPPGLRIILM